MCVVYPRKHRISHGGIPLEQMRDFGFMMHMFIFTFKIESITGTEQLGGYAALRNICNVGAWEKFMTYRKVNATNMTLEKAVTELSKLTNDRTIAEKKVLHRCGVLDTKKRSR